DGAKHPQWVVTISNIWIERRADYFFLKIFDPVEWVEQFAKAIFAKAQRQSVYCKIPSVLVVFQSAVFHCRISTFFGIGFFSCPNKFKFYSPAFKHSSSVCFENGDFWFSRQKF